MKKVCFLVGVVLLLFGAIANADSIDDAARAIYNGDLEATEVSKIFSASEMKKVNEKVKELKLEELKEKKGREGEKKENKLLNLIRSKKNKEAKDNILIDDIDKELGKVKSKVDNLENRVNKLEKKDTQVAKKTEVHRVENKTKKTKLTLKEIVQEVVRGNLGDGQERVENLRKLGYSQKEITAIQKAVNEAMQ